MRRWSDVKARRLVRDILPHQVLLTPDIDVETDRYGWVAEIPDMPGCVSQGATPDDAVASVRGAMMAWRAAGGEPLGRQRAILESATSGRRWGVSIDVIGGEERVTVTELEGGELAKLREATDAAERAHASLEAATRALGEALPPAPIPVPGPSKVPHVTPSRTIPAPRPKSTDDK